MDSLLFVIIFYVLFAMIIWLAIIQKNINEIKEKLTGKNVYENQIQDKPLQEEQVQDFIPQTFEEQKIEPDIYKNEDEISETIDDIKFENIQPEITVNYEKEQKISEKEKNQFEKTFMGNVFNKIGAIAILIALCILIKIISPYIIFTSEMKVATGLISGILMIFGAFKIRKKENMKIFSETLMGTGFGAILITIYCGAGFLEVFSTPVALCLASVTTLIIYFIADKQKTVSSIVIGLIGGYLNPFFVNYDITMNFLFFYLLFLNLLSIIFVYRNQKTEAINIINLILTFICISGFSLINNEISTYQLLILWGMYVLYDILCINKEKIKSKKALPYINFSVLTLLSWIMYENSSIEIGIFTAIIAVLYGTLGLFFYTKTNEKENSYYLTCVIAVFISTFFLTINESFLRITYWSLEALLLMAISLIYGMRKMLFLSIGIFTAAVCKLLITPYIYKDYKQIIFNSRFYYFLAPVISGGIIGFLAKKFKEIKLYETFNFITISLIYYYAIWEINSLLLESGYYNRVFGFVIPIILFIYAINFNLLAQKAENKTLYIVANKITFWSGIIWLIFAEMIFDIYNRAFLPLLNVRFASYAILGVNIFYQLKNKETNWLKYLAIILGFLYVHFESVNTVCYLKDFEWIISVMWILYSGVISVAGICKNKKILKTAGIWLSLLTVVRLFMYDFANLKITYKLIAFIVLGVVLMEVSYLYNKKSEDKNL